MNFSTEPGGDVQGFPSIGVYDAFIIDFHVLNPKPYPTQLTLDGLVDVHPVEAGSAPDS